MSVDLNYALNSEEVLRIVGGGPIAKCVKFYSYSELATVGYPALNCAYLILYRKTDKFGHFCYLLHRFDGVLEFGDPYGIMDSMGKLTPDQQLFWNDQETNARLGQGQNYLSRIMRSFKGKMEYNDFPFMQWGNQQDMSCGYICGIRLQLRYLTLDQFTRVMERTAERIGIGTNELAVVLGNTYLK